MKNLIYILPLTLLFACGGGEEKKEATQEDVCKCSKIYDEKSDFMADQEGAGMTPGEAMDAAKEKFGKDMEECEKIHESVGDEKFYEMSKECK